jgi:hypothetical protein
MSMDGSYRADRSKNKQIGPGDEFTQYIAIPESAGSTYLGEVDAVVCPDGFHVVVVVRGGYVTAIRTGRAA